MARADSEPTPEPNAELRTRFAVRGWSSVALSPAELHALREAPAEAGAHSLPANFHRYSDEQTIAGLSAVLHVLHQGEFDAARRREWGVVVASRFVNRLAIAKALGRLKERGVLAGSPFLVSHGMLHSAAGAITLALQMQGPSFGVGGGAGFLEQGLLGVWHVLADGRVPGLLAVFTSWDPEPIPDASGACTNPTVCRAVALAVEPRDPCAGEIVLQFGSANSSGEAEGGTLAALAESLGRADERGPGLCWSLSLTEDCQAALAREAA